MLRRTVLYCAGNLASGETGGARSSDSDEQEQSQQQTAEEEKEERTFHWQDQIDRAIEERFRVHATGGASKDGAKGEL